MHRESRIANILLTTFCSASLLMLFLPLSRPVRGMKAFLTHVFDPAVYAGFDGVERLVGVPGRVAGLISADIENRTLQEQIRVGALLKAELETLRAENARVRALAGLKAPFGRASIWARVMEREPLRWFHSIAVDVGAADGIPLNAPVLAAVGDRLVALGRVAEVGKKSSKVLLLTDEISSVAACLSSGTAPGPIEGLIQGQGTGRLRMEYIDSEAAVAAGDLVMTSATSATFPPGILIGSVSADLERDPFLTSQSVEVRPIAGPGSVSEVLILK